MRNHLIWVEQPDTAGPIYLKPLTSEPAEEAVHNAIYANPEAMEMAPRKQESVEDVEDEPLETVQDAEDFEQSGDDVDDEDEFSKELSSIQVPSSDESRPPRKPRIPIMELPPLKQTGRVPDTPAELTEESLQ